MNKKISLKMFVISLLACVLLSGTVTYVLAQTPSGTFWVTAGRYPMADFTIWREGGDYFVKNDLGFLIYSGTNATEMIQNALDVGGVIDLSGDTYVLTASPLVVYENTTLRNGELTLANGVDNDIIYSGRSMIAQPYAEPAERFITLEDLDINGNHANQVSGNGIHWFNVYKSTIRNCYIHHMIENGIYFEGEGNWTAHGCSDNYIAPNVRIEYCYKDGIFLENSGENQIHPWVRSCYNNGLRLHNSTNNYITGSYRDIPIGYNILVQDLSRYNKFEGIALSSGNYTSAMYVWADQNYIIGCEFMNSRIGLWVVAEFTIITNNIFVGNEYEGLLLTGPTNTVSNNKFINNGQTPSPAINVTNGNFNMFVGNTVADDGAGAHTYGLIEVGTSDNNTIVACSFIDCTTMGILQIGAFTHVNLVWNGTSWIA